MIIYNKMKQLKWENLEAETLARWLRWQQYRFAHLANESWLPPKVAMLASVRKKRMWVSPWVPDYLICLKRWSLLFIELKKPRTKRENGEWYSLSTDSIKVSPEQTEWIEALHSIDNVSAHICFWSQEAINLIQTLDTCQL